MLISLIQTKLLRPLHKQRKRLLFSPSFQCQPPRPAFTGANMMTQEQAIQLLQKLNLQGYLGNTVAAGSNPNINEGENLTASAGYSNMTTADMFEHKIHPALLTVTRDEGPSS
jgi:hypothetical protein